MKKLRTLFHLAISQHIYLLLIDSVLIFLQEALALVLHLGTKHSEFWLCRQINNNFSFSCWENMSHIFLLSFSTQHVLFRLRGSWSLCQQTLRGKGRLASVHSWTIERKNTRRISCRSTENIQTLH